MLPQPIPAPNGSPSGLRPAAPGATIPVQALQSAHDEAHGNRRTHPRPEHGPHPSAHTVPFELEDKSCSQILFDIMQSAPKDGMTIRALIHSLGERGLLMACMIFCLPSMLPIPIPGMSMPQGLIIMLIGIGIVLNRAPLLPERVLEYRLPHHSLFMVLEKGTRLFHRIEKLSYPRLLALTHGWAHILNGILLVMGALILLAPFPIPFSNVLPAYGILFTAFGTLQRDGWLVIAGYFMYLLTILYITLVFVFGITWIAHLFHADWLQRLLG